MIQEKEENWWIEIFALCYNELLMLPIFVQHYRKRFPDCKITIFNNHSDDGSRELAIALGCMVIDYDTGGKLSDETYLQIKNSCWKNSKKPWVLIVDMDELADINQHDLEFHCEATIIKFEGWNMVSLTDGVNVPAITHGVRSTSYDKMYCFRPKSITEINYGLGCHHANPKGKVVLTNKAYKVLHYKYIDPDYMIKRHSVFASRLSDDNKKRQLGYHYTYPEEKIRQEFAEARKNAIKIL